jgi:hypothetical protein
VSKPAWPRNMLAVPSLCLQHQFGAGATASTQQQWCRSAAPPLCPLARRYGTLVAAKILKGSSDIALGDFRGEIEILRRVHHPNAVQVRRCERHVCGGAGGQVCLQDVCAGGASRSGAGCNTLCCWAVPGQAVS